ncbi:MAG: type III pantothenate kinase [Nitrospira sp.]|nr:type III pantothenate kinase [Nitrospira sp.]
MLLAIDIGNSNVVWGLFQDRTLIGPWRISTDVAQPAAAYGDRFLAQLKTSGIEPGLVTDVALCSVVPSLTPVFEQMTAACFHRTPLAVSSAMDTGLTLLYTDPGEIGADRLANAAAAYDRYKTALIVVDLGTATTFCAITQRGEFLGGAIAPGLGIAAEALFSRTAQLPRVDFARPKTVIGRDTKSSIQAGLIIGYAGLVDTLVSRIEDELGQKAFVVATGGLASLVAPESRTIQEVRPNLTLEGLAFLHRRTLGRDKV